MTSEEQCKNYVILLELLLQAKRQLITIGNEFGLTGMQTFTLVLTDPDELQPMNNLCSVFCCDASNMTGIIDGLEQKKLARRQSHPKDRRIKVVRLEPEGLKVRTQIMQHLTDRNSELFGKLTDAETKQLVVLLQKLARPAP